MGLRSSGCWTCRIRHRKCDLRTPTCDECTDRNIHCHGYGRKPSWMDGAAEEEKEKSKIRDAVKENFRSLRRMQNRARQNRRAITGRLQGAGLDVEERAAGGPSPSPHDEDYNNHTPTDMDNADSLLTPVNRPSGLEPGHPQSIETELTSRASSRKTGMEPHEASLLMHYLDQVFSWQFPYHSYDSRSGNRGWLLLLLTQQGPLYHAILSLSALHHSALFGRAEEYSQQRRAFDRHSRALRELCAFMSCKEDELLGDIVRMAEFLSSSIMLITFEVVFRGGEHDWQIHLNAATSALRQLSVESVLRSKDSRDDCKLDDIHECLQSRNYSDQYGLQFVISAALWFDLLSCVSTSNAPVLPYNEWLSIPGFDMANLMGCQNWVMASIGDLANLRVWKDENLQNGLLSMRELAAKGQQIETALEDGLANLEFNGKEIGDTKAKVNTFWVSRVFALAALVLLHTIISGPLPKLPEIENAVSRTIVALRARPHSCPSNGIVWALCIASSMAQPPAQQLFEAFMEEMLAEHGRFGNCFTVLRVMRKCWELQQSRQADWREAMSEMGICALFI